ncbi:MAG: SDR family NAD(P)-dependent oxidoreductase [Ramlibacter sp.]|nr:SDR family NAD(P)-dependent oxidoreductase [Ramlibacter sp.]
MTDATSGVGAACVAQLAGAGHHVIALGRCESRLRELAAPCPPGRVSTLISDLRDRSRLRASLASLPNPFSCPDTLINNAGLMLGQGRFDELSEEDAQAMITANCTGMLNATSALLDSLSASGRGHIVNVTSIAASHPYAGGHVYAASKAFVESFGDCLRVELVERRIKVTNVSPGGAGTGFNLVHTLGNRALSAQGGMQVAPLDDADVARAIGWALDQPDDVNVNALARLF